MNGYRKYYSKKIIWYVLTLIVAVILNFLLPRLMPGNPVSAIAARAAVGVTDQTAVQKVYENYVKIFGIDKPLHVQFFHYIVNIFKGDFGVSFIYYPRTVSDILAKSIGWTIALQLPAILVGWFLGNLLGAVAAYIRKGWDKGVLPAFLFLSNMPAFGMAILLLFFFGVHLKWFPTSLGYGYNMNPNMSLQFIGSVIYHYQLPFWSIVLITIGGQAIGMRSMSIYELDADYVKYSRFLGIKDSKVVKYVFRNAMLPQITGLALSLGTMVGGALVAEIIFSYPGLGTTLLAAITGRDYPVISGCTLIITIMVLIANLAVEILYGFIDPRVKAVQQD
ncbi:MAG TPA: ABC transporter permease [Clostridiaceae bacterium]|nr:ABC transporter permease [Clostridiaceae bacterium]